MRQYPPPLKKYVLSGKTEGCRGEASQIPQPKQSFRGTWGLEGNLGKLGGETCIMMRWPRTTSRPRTVGLEPPPPPSSQEQHYRPCSVHAVTRGTRPLLPLAAGHSTAMWHTQSLTISCLSHLVTQWPMKYTPHRALLLVGRGDSGCGQRLPNPSEEKVNSKK